MVNVIGTTSADLIDGSNVFDSIESGEGNDTVKGYAGDDYLRGNQGNDVIYGGLGNDDIGGGKDNDRLYGEGGNDLVAGGKGHDIIYGGAGNDILEGDDGDDSIFADIGNDILRGGLGGDRFVIARKAGATDIIEDFEINNTLERIDLSAFDNYISNFSLLSPSIIQVGADTHINLIDNQKVILKNVNASSLTGNKFIGNASSSEINETIYGGENADEIYGLDGDDTIYGGGGDDVLKGNEGNDFIHGNAGNDNIAGGYGDDELRGGQGDDYIKGASGNDVAYGGQGNDILLGSFGYDELFGEEGDDILYANNEYDQYLQDIAQFDADYYLSIYQDVANAGLDAYQHYIDYGRSENRSPNAYFDAAYYLEANSDVAAAVAGGEYIDGWEHFLAHGYEEGRTFYRQVGSHLHGGAGNDTIYGSVQGDTIIGGIGNDIVRGGLGKDIFVITNDSSSYDIIEDFNSLEDKFVLEGFDEITSLEQIDIAYILEGTLISFSNNQQIVLQGVNPSSITSTHFFGGEIVQGTENNDNLQGFEEGDYIAGKEGDDVIHGYGGNDTLEGNAGNDEIYGGSGDDSIHSGKGGDVAYGGAGDDTVYGGEGNDTIFGNEGNDILHGNEGDDIVGGGKGNDIVKGGKGSDILKGGAGDDIYRGGEGRDVFEIQRDAGSRDVIEDFNLNERIDVTSLVHLASYEDITFSQEGSSAILDFGYGQTLEIKNTNISQLGQQNFIGNWSAVKVANIFTVGALFAHIDPSLNRIQHYIIENFHPLINPDNSDSYKPWQIIDVSHFNLEQVNLVLGSDGNSTIVDLGADKYLEIRGVTPDQINPDVHFITNGNIRYLGAEDNVHEGNFDDESVSGGLGNDQLEGQGGHDFLSGNQGDDFIDGGHGNDVLKGGKGNDEILGGSGNDVLFSGEGNDILEGGHGRDSFVIRKSPGSIDLIRDFYTDARLDLTDFVGLSRENLNVSVISRHFDVPEEARELLGDYEVGPLSPLTKVDLGEGQYLYLQGSLAQLAYWDNILYHGSDPITVKDSLAEDHPENNWQTRLLSDWDDGADVSLAPLPGGEAIQHQDDDLYIISIPSQFAFVNNDFQARVNIGNYTIDPHEEISVIKNFNPFSPYQNIDLSNFTFIEEDVVAIGQDGEDTLISLGQDRTIVLEGVNANHISNNIFASANGNPQIARSVADLPSAGETEIEQLLASGEYKTLRFDVLRLDENFENGAVFDNMEGGLLVDLSKFFHIKYTSDIDIQHIGDDSVVTLNSINGQSKSFTVKNYLLDHSLFLSADDPAGNALFAESIVANKGAPQERLPTANNLLTVPGGQEGETLLFMRFADSSTANANVIETEVILKNNVNTPFLDRVVQSEAFNNTKEAFEFLEDSIDRVAELIPNKTAQELFSFFGKRPTKLLGTSLDALDAYKSGKDSFIENNIGSFDPNDPLLNQFAGESGQESAKRALAISGVESVLGIIFFPVGKVLKVTKAVKAVGDFVGDIASLSVDKLIEFTTKKVIESNTRQLDIAASERGYDFVSVENDGLTFGLEISDNPDGSVNVRVASVSGGNNQSGYRGLSPDEVQAILGKLPSSLEGKPVHLTGRNSDVVGSFVIGEFPRLLDQNGLPIDFDTENNVTIADFSISDTSAPIEVGNRPFTQQEIREHISGREESPQSTNETPPDGQEQGIEPSGQPTNNEVGSEVEQEIIIEELPPLKDNPEAKEVKPEEPKLDDIIHPTAQFFISTISGALIRGDSIEDVLVSALENSAFNAAINTTLDLLKGGAQNTIFANGLTGEEFLGIFTNGTEGMALRSFAEGIPVFGANPVVVSAAIAIALSTIQSLISGQLLENPGEAVASITINASLAVGGSFLGSAIAAGLGFGGPVGGFIGGVIGGIVGGLLGFSATQSLFGGDKFDAGEDLINSIATHGDDFFAGYDLEYLRGSFLGGDDIIAGGNGWNDLDGGNGNDIILGGNGRVDVLYGGNGDDYIHAFESYGDDLRGGGGDDIVVGSNGHDGVVGGEAHFRIDYVRGSTLDGNDKLFARGGNDHLDGGIGGDILVAGSGQDISYGQGGRDIYRIEVIPDDFDTIIFEFGQDKIDLSLFGFSSINELNIYEATRVYSPRFASERRDLQSVEATGIVIDLPDGQSLFIPDASIDSINEDDFIFDGVVKNIFTLNQRSNVAIGTDERDVFYADDLPLAAIFDAEYYLANNEDVAESGVDPYQHFVDDGQFEGRNPNQYFNTNYYLQLNGDVSEPIRKELVGVGVISLEPAQGAFAHFVLHGIAEGRVFNDSGEGLEIAAFYVEAGGGDDIVYGTSVGDELHGNQGNDQIFGGGGDDLLKGGKGDDLIVGSLGNDIIYGGNDDDELRGGRGDDILYGGNGNDIVAGGQGYNELYGGSGRDTFAIVQNFDGIGSADVIKDFSYFSDVIDLTSYLGYRLFFDELDLVQVGNNVEIYLPTDKTVIVENTNISDISEDNFVGVFGRQTMQGGIANAILNITARDNFITTIDKFDSSSNIINILDAARGISFGSLNIFQENNDVMIEIPEVNNTIILKDTNIASLSQSNFTNIEYIGAEINILGEASYNVSDLASGRGVASRITTIQQDGEVSITVDSVSTSNNNAIGWYEIDSDGTIRNPRILVGSSGNAAAGETYSLGNLTAGTQVGFFIIAGGANGLWSGVSHYHYGYRNVSQLEEGSLSLVNVYSRPANIYEDSQTYLYYEDSNGVLYRHTAQIYHSNTNNDLNADGQAHSQASFNEEAGEFLISFEDQYGSYNQSFDDFSFYLNSGNDYSAEELSSVLSIGDININNFGNISSAYVTLQQGYVEGDVLELDGYEIGSDGVIVGTNISATFYAVPGSLHVVLQGKGSAELYSDILSSLKLVNEHASLEELSGTRGVRIDVVNDVNEQSTITTSIEILSDSEAASNLALSLIEEEVISYENIVVPEPEEEASMVIEPEEITTVEQAQELMLVESISNNIEALPTVHYFYDEFYAA